MSTTIIFLEALIITILLVLIYYQYVGWISFSYKTGDVVAWQANDISRLRFSNCIFTVTTRQGQIQSKDVTPVLNSMAVAYANLDKTKLPPTLYLTRPLNAFSFVIKGFNDRDTVSDPTSPKWCGADTDPSVACPDSAKATLTGSFKIL